MTTLKTILDAVLGESGFIVPTSYTNSPNPDDQQLVYLANASADALREIGLGKLRKFASIALTAATNYTLPSDFLSYISDTAYANSRVDSASLPTTPQDWAFLKASGSFSGATYRARFYDGKLQVLNPVAGQTITFEYLSSTPWTDSGGVAKESATLDTDLWVLDRRLLQMATKWRWKKEKGLPDWQADLQLFQAYANNVRGRDGGARTVYFGMPEQGLPEPYTPLWVS